jgi:hypothetical protein
MPREYHAASHLTRLKQMSANVKQPANDPITDLAAKIYIELICRNVVVTEGAAQIKSNPENLAKISFKLAEAFLRVTVEVKGSNEPKNQAFEVQSADLANWGTPKA